MIVHLSVIPLDKAGFLFRNKSKLSPSSLKQPANRTLEKIAILYRALGKREYLVIIRDNFC